MLADTTSTPVEAPPLIVCGADPSDVWACLSMRIEQRSYAGARLMCCKDLAEVSGG